MKLRPYTFGILMTCIISIAHVVAFAQVYSDKVVGKKNAELIDSIKTTEYPYALPIWAKKLQPLDLIYPIRPV